MLWGLTALILKSKKLVFKGSFHPKTLDHPLPQPQTVGWSQVAITAPVGGFGMGNVDGSSGLPLLTDLITV